jgi:hypothetical protein
MKNYIGNPLTGKITIQSPPKELSPRLVEAMNGVSHKGLDLTREWEGLMCRSTWEVTEAMYVPATNILHSYGYTPAVRS